LCSILSVKITRVYIYTQLHKWNIEHIHAKQYYNMSRNSRSNNVFFTIVRYGGNQNLGFRISIKSTYLIDSAWRGHVYIFMLTTYWYCYSALNYWIICFQNTGFDVKTFKKNTVSVSLNSYTLCKHDYVTLIDHYFIVKKKMHLP